MNFCGDDDGVSNAAGQLMRILGDKEWYHRTTICYEVKRGDFIRVYGEGERPADLPEKFFGWPVEFYQVSKLHPCPFGSVRKEYAS